MKKKKTKRKKLMMTMVVMIMMKKKWVADTCYRLSTKSRAKTWILALLRLAFALIRAT